MSKETDQLGKDILKQLSHLLSFSRDISLGTDCLIQKMPQADEVFHSQSFSSIEKEISDFNCFTDYFTGPSAEQILHGDGSDIFQEHSVENLYSGDKYNSEVNSQITDSAIKSSDYLQNSEESGGDFFNEKSRVDNAQNPGRTKIGSFSDLFKKVSETEKKTKEAVSDKPEAVINSGAEIVNTTAEPLQDFNTEVSNNFLLQLKKIISTSDNKDLVKVAEIVESLVLRNSDIAGIPSGFKGEVSNNPIASIHSENINKNRIINKSDDEDVHIQPIDNLASYTASDVKKNKSELLRDIDALKNSSADISVLAEIVKALVIENFDQKKDAKFKSSVLSENSPQIFHNAAEKTTNSFNERSLGFNEDQVNLNMQTGGIPANENQIASENPVHRKLRIEDAEAKNASTSFINSYAGEDNYSAFSNDFNENKFSEPVIERFRSEKPAAKLDDAAYKMSKELRLNFQRYFSE